jgi:hypothetical protein
MALWLAGWVLRVLVVLCTGGLGLFVWYNSSPPFPVAASPVPEDGEQEEYGDYNG